MVHKLAISALLFSCAAQAGGDISAGPVFSSPNGIEYEFDYEKKMVWDLGADYGIEVKALDMMGLACISASEITLCKIQSGTKLVDRNKVKFMGVRTIETLDSSLIEVREHLVKLNGHTTVQWSTPDGLIVGFCIPGKGGHTDSRYLTKTRSDLLDISSFVRPES